MNVLRGVAAPSLQVGVHGPMVTDVHDRPRCGSMKADPADIKPEATPQGASVSSDDRSSQGSIGFGVVGLTRARSLRPRGCSTLEVAAVGRHTFWTPGIGGGNLHVGWVIGRFGPLGVNQRYLSAGIEIPSGKRERLGTPGPPGSAGPPVGAAIDHRKSDLPRPVARPLDACGPADRGGGVFVIGPIPPFD